MEEQIGATTDPKLKADLSRQLTVLLSKRTRKGSPRKPVSVQKSSAPEGHGDLNRAVIEFEMKAREQKIRTGQALTETDRHALLEEVTKSLVGEA